MSDTTATVRIIVVSSGTDDAAKKIKDIGGGAKGSAAEVSALKNTMKFSAAVAAAEEVIRVFVDMNDKLVVLNNKLLVFQNVQGGSAAALDNIQRIATITGASLGDVASAYTRLTLASHDLGLTQSEVESLTASLFKGFILLSGSADGAKDSIRVLDQALERGYVNVRELRSLAGQNPLILNALAEALGHSSSELFKITAQGKLSGEELSRAFNTIAPTIEKTFQQATPTISQELEKITTSVEIAVNKITSKIPNIANWFLEHVNDSIRITTGQQTGEAEKIIGEMKARDAAQAALQRRTTTPDSRSTLQNDFVTDTLEKQKKALAVAQAEADGTAAEAAGAKVIANLTEKKIISETQFNELLKEGNSLYNINTKYGQQLDSTTYNQLVNNAKNVELLKSAGQLAKQLGINQSEYNEKLTVADFLRDKFNKDAKAQLVIAEHLLQIEADRLRLSPDSESAKQRGGILIDIQNGDNRGISDSMVATYNNVAGAARTYGQALSAVNELQKEGKITQEQATDELVKAQIAYLDTQKDVTSGFERGFLKVGEDIKDFASSSEKVVTNAFSSMEDAVVEFVKTGKLDFHALTESILADLTRLLFKQALSGLLSSFGGGFGSFFSGGFGGSVGGGGLPARATGGPVTAGQPYVVGERGPEIFNPSSNGSITPNGAIGTPPVVHVSVVNVSDPDEVSHALGSNKGQQTIVNTMRKNRDAVRNALGIV